MQAWNTIRDHLVDLGWKICHNSAGEETLVRFSNPRIGYKPATGTLIIGYHEWPEKVWDIEQLNRILK